MAGAKPGSLFRRVIAMMPVIFLNGVFMALVPQTVFTQEASKSPTPSQPSFDYDKYEVGTLKQIIKFHESFVDEHKKKAKEYEKEKPNAVNPDAIRFLLYSADEVPTKVRVKYTGMTRKLRPDVAEMLSNWAKTGMAGSAYVNLFKWEMLFIEGTDEHWLPVQSQLIPFFKKELRKGDDVGLYVVWVGYLDIKPTGDWVFLVNEFLKPDK